MCWRGPLLSYVVALADPASGRGERIEAEPLGHVPAIDGLRALFVLAVAAYHSRFEWIQGGFLGVSAFFTLSGFLITALLLREWTGPNGLGLRSFWARRFRRLLPAAWVTVCLVVLLGAIGAWSSSQLRQLATDVPFALAEVVNWHFVAQDRSYGASLSGPSPIEHFWSLAVEQQFYVILPLVIAGVLRWRSARSRRERLRRLTFVLGAVLVASAVANGVLATGSIDRAYFGTDTRMAEMLVGALLAVLTLRRLRPASLRLRRAIAGAGVAAGAVTVVLWNVATVGSQWLYPWGLLLTAGCTAAVILAASQNGPLASVLSLGPLVWLGKLSYGIYLLHWPIFLVLTPARVGWAPWPLFALRMTVTVAAAALLYHMVEQPVRAGTRLVRPRGWVAAGVAAPVLLVTNLAVTGSADPPTRLEVALAEAPATTTTIPPPPVQVLVVGDQFAASIGAALGPADRTEVTVATVPTCGLVLGGWVVTAGGDVELDVDRCRAARDGWVAAAASTRPDVVMVVPGLRDVADRRLNLQQPWSGPLDPTMNDFIRTGIGTLIDDLSDSGAQIVAVTVPYMRNTEVPVPQPVSLASGEPGTLDQQLGEFTVEQMREGARAEFAENDDARIDELNRIVDAVATSRGVHLLDLAGEIRSWPEGELDPRIRPDGVVLAGEGASRIADWLVPRLVDLTPQPVAAPPPPPILDVEAPLPEAPTVVPRRALSPTAAPRVLFVGDSVAVDLVLGLGASAPTRPDRPLEVESAAKAGCPIARGGSYRTEGDTRVIDGACSWENTFPLLVAAHRPDVVAMSSGPWEVADRRFPGDDRFRHIGDPGVDRYLLREYLTAVDALSSDGALVAIVVQPPIQLGLARGLVDLPESDPARMQRLNEIYAEVAELRPGVVRLVDLAGLLREWGAERDPAVRPDGLHFSDEHSRLVGSWLGDQLWALAHGD